MFNTIFQAWHTRKHVNVRIPCLKPYIAYHALDWNFGQRDHNKDLYEFDLQDFEGNHSYLSHRNQVVIITSSTVNTWYWYNAVKKFCSVIAVQRSGIVEADVIVCCYDKIELLQLHNYIVIVDNAHAIPADFSHVRGHRTLCFNATGRTDFELPIKTAIAKCLLFDFKFKQQPARYKIIYGKNTESIYAVQDYIKNLRTTLTVNEAVECYAEQVEVIASITTCEAYDILSTYLKFPGVRISANYGASRVLERVASKCTSVKLDMLSWWEKYKQIKLYCNATGFLPFRSQFVSGIAASAWIDKQLHKQISTARKSAIYMLHDDLNKIVFKRTDGLQILAHFVASFNRMPRPCDCYAEFDLYKFVENLRKQFCNSITPTAEIVHRISLDILDVNYNWRLSCKFIKNFTSLPSHGKMSVWVNMQRQLYAKGILCAHSIETLNAINPKILHMK